MRSEVGIHALACCLIGAAALPTPAAQADEPPPNVLLICVNDLGYGDLGCYGQERIETPNIDRLAERGVLFTDYYAADPDEEASQFALMTGRRMPPSAGADSGDSHSSHSTLGNLFKESGYRTGMLGRWPVHAPGPSRPNLAGFDEWLGFPAGEAPENPYLETIWRNQDPLKLSSKISTQERKTVHEVLTGAANNFIVLNKSRPFFICLAFTLPAPPFERLNPGKETPEPWPDAQIAFAEMMAQVDSSVGHLVDLLAKLELENRTLIVLTSDSGPHDAKELDPGFFNRDGKFDGAQGSLKEGGLRIPMILSLPGRFDSGRRAAALAGHFDLAPTFAELIGAKRATPWPGVSLLPVLENPEASLDRDSLYWTRMNGGSAAAIRHEHWKAVRLGPSEKWSLYDLSEDPLEQRNIAKQHRWKMWRIKRKIPRSLR